MLSQRGFAPLVIIVVSALIGLGIIGAVINSTNKTAPEPSTTVSASPVPSVSAAVSATPSVSVAMVKPSLEPQVDCTGPDGKKFKTTKKVCDNLNKAWATPTPSPSPSTASSSSSSSNSASSSGNCSNGQVSISIQPNNGSVVGDTLIRVSVRSNDQGCNSGYSNETILRNGQSSLNLGGLTPATYNLFVSYHGVQYNESFTITSGGSASKTVNVSN